MALAVRYKAKECPCCGGPGQVKTVNTPHSHGWVGCTTCGLYIQWNWDPHDALDKWNRRAAQPQGKWDNEEDPDWSGGGFTKCSACGYGFSWGNHFEPDSWSFCPKCGAKMDIASDAGENASRGPTYDLLYEEGGIDT